MERLRDFFFILFIVVILRISTVLITIDIGIIIFIMLLAFYIIIKPYIKMPHELNVSKEETQHLQALCEELCESFAKDLKKKRNKIKILAIIILLLALYIPLDVEIARIVICFIILVLFVILLIIVNTNYNNLYKEEVMHKFIKIYKKDFAYSNDRQSKLDMEMKYKNSGFSKTNNYSLIVEVEDYIYGNIKENVYMQMADIYSYLSEGRIGSDAIGSTKDEMNALFIGNFMILDVNKTFEESKIIRNKINIFDRKELLDTDNELFNKYFEIHAQNKERVQTYLTPSLIQFIAEFREKYKIDFEIIFKDKIYIRFYTRNMYEPKMFGKIIDDYSVYQFYVITKFAKDLVEKIDVDN